MKVIANKENLHIVDTCVRCKANICEGEKYYDINGKIFCQKCTILNFKNKTI